MTASAELMASGIERCLERFAGDLAQQFIRAALHERHSAGVNQIDFDRIDIEQVDMKAGFAGQNNAQRQAHMAAATYNGDSLVVISLRYHSSWDYSFDVRF